MLKRNVRQIGRTEFDSIGAAEYAGRTFGMFGGEVVRVKLRFRNGMEKVAYDKFGTDIMLVPDDEGHFVTYVYAAVSPQFNGWIFGLGDNVEIIYPQSVVDGFLSQMSMVKKMY